MLDMEFARNELAFAQQMLGTINSRLMTIDVQTHTPSQVEHVFKYPKVGSAPTELIPFSKMAATSVCTMILPFLVSLLWEYRVSRISSVQEFEANTSRLPLVAEVTRLPVQTLGRSKSNRLQHDLWLFEESVETLRTCLMLAAKDRDLQVIAITSASSREGKTSVASQLAVSLAGASGQPTLLIDGDMRSPDIHGIFDVQSETGLTDVLARRLSLDETVCATWQTNLDILPAGNLTCSPHNLLGKETFKQIVDAARQKYRFIVIDTPPILAASEALIMAKEADAALLCAMRAVSRSHQVHNAHLRLCQAGANPVGLVLNGVPTQSYYYKYGKYSYTRD